MEVLARVMTSSASASPLKNDGEVRRGRSNVDDLANAVDGSYRLTVISAHALGAL